MERVQRVQRAEGESETSESFDLRRSTRDVERIRFQKQIKSIKGWKCRRGGATRSHEANSLAAEASSAIDRRERKRKLFAVPE
jgi:ribosomal protein L20